MFSHNNNKMCVRPSRWLQIQRKMRIRIHTLDRIIVLYHTDFASNTRQWIFFQCGKKNARNSFRLTVGRLAPNADNFSCIFFRKNSDAMLSAIYSNCEFYRFQLIRLDHSNGTTREKTQQFLHQKCKAMNVLKKRALDHAIRLNICK